MLPYCCAVTLAWGESAQSLTHRVARSEPQFLRRWTTFMDGNIPQYTNQSGLSEEIINRIA